MPASTTDTVFKIISVVSALIVIPLFTWVWSTQGRVERIEVEFSTVRDDVKKIGDNSTDIQLIKKDIGFIKDSLVEIKSSLNEIKK